MQRAPNKPDATGIKRFENKNCMLYKENAELTVLNSDIKKEAQKS